MKVAYILKYFPKLSETFIIEEILQLVRKGIEIDIYSFLDCKPERTHQKVEEILSKCRVKYYQTYNPYNIMANIAKNPAFGIRTPELVVRSHVARLFDDIKHDRPDIVHSHFIWERSEIAVHIGDKFDIPTTITCHAKDIFKPDMRRLKTVAGKAAKIITISNFNKHYLGKLKVPEEKIEVIHCGIDPEIFKPDGEKIKDEEMVHVATTGRLIEKKGTIYLLKAVRNVISARKGRVFLHVIGNGPLRTKLEKFVRHNELQDNVRIYGDLIDMEVKRILNKTHIFVLPCMQASDGDMDGIPVSLMEAMAMEKGVISTGISGIPELVSDEVDGLLAEQKDVQGIEKRIMELANDPNKRETLGSNARKKIIKEFNSKKTSARLLDLWHELI